MKFKAHHYGPDFFGVVRSMPFFEADQLLRDRIHDANAARVDAQRRKDGNEQAELEALLSKLKDELHMRNRANRDYQMQTAVKTLFGDEGWAQVKQWLIENSPETA